MSKLRAFTLIEMMVSISVGSVLMALALGMVHRTMRVESAARAHQAVERTAARLSRQFRHDIHQTQSVALDRQQAGSPNLRLLLPAQHPITYRITNSGVLREQQQSPESGPIRRELFTFPADHTLRFAEHHRPARAVLTLVRDDRLVGVPPQVRLHVEAVIGQFLQLHSSGEDGR